MRIAIIGGGFTGLSAAYELCKRGHQVSVFEKDKELGGLAVGWPPFARLSRASWGKSADKQWSLERGYHHLFTGDETIINLIRELGLGDKLIIKRPITATLWKDKLYQLDSVISLLKFPALPIFDRIRTGAMLAFFKLWPFWQLLERITAERLIRLLGGAAGWRVIWEPLLKGKFGPYAVGVAASWFWARIVKRTPALAYPGGGFQTIIEALAQTIKKNGGKIYTQTELVKLDQLGKFGDFDKVILTIPTPLIAKLAPELKVELTKALAIPHLHAQVLILETNAPILKDVYWLNVTDTTYPFLAVVAHTNLIDKKYYNGKHITYIGNYLPDGHPFLKLNKDQLFNKFFPYIKKLNQQFNNVTIQQLYLFTVPFAQPVHELNYSSRAPKLETSIRGVFIANMDSVYPWDRGTNYAVELGINVARRMDI